MPTTGNAHRVYVKLWRPQNNSSKQQNKSILQFTKPLHQEASKRKNMELNIRDVLYKTWLYEGWVQCKPYYCTGLVKTATILKRYASTLCTHEIHTVCCVWDAVVIAQFTISFVYLFIYFFYLGYKLKQLFVIHTALCQLTVIWSKSV